MKIPEAALAKTNKLTACYQIQADRCQNKPLNNFINNFKYNQLRVILLDIFQV